MIDPNADDHELMRRLAEDSTAALEELMRRWQAAVQRLVMRSVRDAGAAEEITQETFFRLWRARTQYQFTGKFSTWLFRIAVRLSLDHHRSRARRPSLVEDEGIEMVAATSPTLRPDRGLYEEELATSLDRALAQLPLNQRLALEMNRFEDMSYAEVAQTLECSVGAVEQLIFRARKRLRELLKDHLGTAPQSRAAAHPPMEEEEP